ncbi:MAG: type I methionyl aminopeptidase [Candidatus Omnitrophica bacterium]|nr:type I methionyl aminopeptidase [Candidatus Omnitrophota bacterium]
MNTTNQIKIKSPQEIKILREAGQILASVIKELTCSLKIGMSTAQIDAVTEKLIKKNKVKPAFKGYRGYPACACVSVNDEVVHGIPSDRQVKEGDIVSIDVGIIYKDYYSDTAVTIGMGSIDPDLEKLLKVTETALHRGIAQAKAGNHLTDISHAIQEYVEEQNYSVVREFVGHGIGRKLHEAPEIPNFGPAKGGPILQEGMVFAIEPMVNIGTWKTKIENDGWTVVTADGKYSAHFEHSIVITKKKPEILTK